MAERIAVLGAGAIGASIGAYLIREGHDVILIDQWAAHVEKMKSDGLRLTDLNGEFTVPVKALHLSEVSNLREQFDIVYLSVKSYDTRWFTYFIEPFLKPTGFILPAQNGLNDEAVASIVGFNRTVGCVPSISVGVYEPGHVIRTDPLTTHCFTVGELSGLITPRVRKLVDALKVLGPSEATTNIWGARWSKLIINCMNNALSGILGPAFSSLNEKQKDTANLIRAVTGSEVAKVAQALGIVVEPVFGIPSQDFVEATTSADIRALKDTIAAVFKKRYLTSEKTQKLGAPDRPSLLQDVLKGRRTEVDYLNGEAVKKGGEVGVPTPMNQAILNLMNELEEGKVKPDPSNLKRLESYLVI
ncbi:MAG: ketopantoate reductase family protein [Dehalococcoidales bacterium]